MNRRSFFKLLGTGATVAAVPTFVRTWPFRVYSFPTSTSRVDLLDSRYWSTLSPQSFDHMLEYRRLVNPEGDIGRGSGSVWMIGPNGEPTMVRAGIPLLQELRSKGHVFKVTEVNQDEKSITLASIISPDTSADRLHSSLERSVDDVYSTVSRLSDSGKRADDLLHRRLGIRSSRRDDDRHI